MPLYTGRWAGPGGDWTTLVHLYSNVDVYTAQLRALESYCAATPKAASARFLLAAMYMTQGGNDAAAARFRDVVAIRSPGRPALEPASPTRLHRKAARPSDDSPNRAGRQRTTLRSASPEPDPGASAERAPRRGGPAVTRGAGAGQAGRLLGREPGEEDVNITLAIIDDKSFKGKVNDRGQSREFQGVATFDNDTLALSAADQPPMVGTVAWKDDGNFLFKALGAPPADPGLTFGK